MMRITLTLLKSVGKLSNKTEEAGWPMLSKLRGYITCFQTHTLGTLREDLTQAFTLSTESMAWGYKVPESII